MWRISYTMAYDTSKLDVFNSLPNFFLCHLSSTRRLLLKFYFVGSLFEPRAQDLNTQLPQPLNSQRHGGLKLWILPSSSTIKLNTEATMFSIDGRFSTSGWLEMKKESLLGVKVFIGVPNVEMAGALRVRMH